MERKYTTTEEVISLPRISSASISPDGMYAAYVKRTTDWKENAYKNHTWIYERETKRHYPLTSGKCESTGPSWSSKNYLAYISETGKDDDKKSQIFIKTFDENNGIQITYAKEGVEKFKWSPDGSRIFYTTVEEDSEEIKNRKEVYGDFEFIDKEYKNNSLYYIEIDRAIEEYKKSNNKPKLPKKDKEETLDISVQLTNPRDFNIIGFDISPDGRTAALVCTPTSKITDNDTVLNTFDIETKTVKKLNVEGVFGSFGYAEAAFSPCGRKIAYLRMPHDREYYKTNVEEISVLEIYDLDEDKTTVRFSEFDRDFMLVSWTKRGILGRYQDKTRFLAGFATADGVVTPLFDEEFSFVDSISSSLDGENIAYVNIAKNEILEFYINGERITSGSKVYENKALSIKRLITWKTGDGLEIEGVLSLPEDFNDTKKYPLLLVVHGGPTWASFPVHNMSIYPIEQFVERGYIVLEPNYRGSSGYGNKHQTANYRMLGIGDYEDVISGVDCLIEKGIADKDRVGIMGWSQGGYISAFCSTYSSRFKAISVGAGISNWMTYYVNTDITTFTREYLANNPWMDPEIYAKTSPMTYIKSACTPTLIQHGSSDQRVPVPNAFELYRGLQDMGVESELVIFKGMKHGPAKPGLQRAIMEQNFEWFTRHIK